MLKNQSTVTNRSPIVRHLKARIQSNVLTWAPDFRSDPSELSVAGAKKAWSGDPNSDRFPDSTESQWWVIFSLLES